MKKLLSIALAAIILFGVFVVMSQPKEGKIGETYVSDGLEFTLNALEMTDVIDGWGGANDDFWKPLDENNCNIGKRYATLKSYKKAHGLVPNSEDDRIVYFSYTAKNVDKRDIIVDEVGLLNYDNGYEYSEGKLAYRVSAEGVWKEIPSGISLQQLKENEYEFRGYMVVPKEVVESDKSLTYTLYGYEFVIR